MNAPTILAFALAAGMFALSAWCVYEGLRDRRRLNRWREEHRELDQRMRDSEGAS